MKPTSLLQMTPQAYLILAMALVAPGCGGNDSSPPSQTVHYRVLLPVADASLKIDDVQTDTTGTVRVFNSSPLEPGKDYKLVLEAYWMPNNYTMFRRKRTFTIRAGPEVTLDLRDPAKEHPDQIFVRYVPTPPEVVEGMLRLAGVGEDDVVYDLGCGDGRIVVAAVDKFHARRGVGIDIDIERIRQSRANAKVHGVENRVEFRRADVLKLEDLSAATVVALYLSDELNVALKPLLLNQLRPRARVVSHRFLMGDWKPLQTKTITDSSGEENVIHLWRVGPRHRGGQQRADASILGEQYPLLSITALGATGSPRLK